MSAIRRMIPRAPAAVVLALFLVAGVVGVAGAAEPAGPRLAVIKETWDPRRVSLLTVGPRGQAPVRLAGGQEKNGPVDSFMVAPLSWRPDGAEVAYSADFGFFLAGADRSGARRINVADAALPVFSPDGRAIAFMRTDDGGAAIWTLDLASGEQHRLTPLRRGLRFLPSSFSADGTTLLATRIDRRRSDLEPVALSLITGAVTRLRRDGLEPVYSPDGSKIALLREVGKLQSDDEEGGGGRTTTDLFVLDAASGSLRRLTRTPGKEELFPSWDPSGERIAFTRFRGSRYEWANSIVQINADGTCETEVLARKRTVFYGAAWKPGPGRGAGPIDC